jgi:CRISPR-associated protein Csy2
MNQYLVLSQVSVQNANNIAGLTWGFPAITQFMGFVHALDRKISSRYQGDYSTELSGCAVIANDVNNKVYQPKPYADLEFLQSKNPPVLAKHKAKGSAPIIEEGKLNMTVSLVIEIGSPLSLTVDATALFENKIDTLCRGMRIAGGTVLNIGNVTLLSASTEVQKTHLLRRVKSMCRGGYALKDRSAYLAAHVGTVSAEKENVLFEAWLDFSRLKSSAKPLSESDKDAKKTAAEWSYENKPFTGFLVPLMTGYKAISDVYSSEQISSVRDASTPARFVEAVHTVGEWVGASRIDCLDDYVWRYHNKSEWYLCQQTHNNNDSVLQDNEDELSSELQENMNQILNLF